MLGLLGDEWTLLVIQQALMGATRYSDFQSRCRSRIRFCRNAFDRWPTTGCWNLVCIRRIRLAPSM
jgi:hypothetical protein